MSLTYKGITPTLVVDTTSLQNNVQVAGTKWQRKSDGKFVATDGNEGICATLVASWLSMRAEGTMVTKLSQFPNNFGSRSRNRPTRSAARVIRCSTCTG